MKAALLALLLALFLSAAPAQANGNPRYTYRDGVLQGYQREPSEGNCVEGSHTPGSVSTTGSSSCADEYSIVYLVESGGAIYILTPRGDMDEAKCGLLSRATIPHSVLDHQPPRTHIKLRSDGRHFFVKIGDRESVYSVARVE